MAAKKTPELSADAWATAQHAGLAELRDPHPLPDDHDEPQDLGVRMITRALAAVEPSARAAVAARLGLDPDDIPDDPTELVTLELWQLGIDWVGDLLRTFADEEIGMISLDGLYGWQNVEVLRAGADLYEVEDDCDGMTREVRHLGAAEGFDYDDYAYDTIVQHDWEANVAYGEGEEESEEVMPVFVYFPCDTAHLLERIR